MPGSDYSQLCLERRTIFKETLRRSCFCENIDYLQNVRHETKALMQKQNGCSNLRKYIHFKIYQSLTFWMWQEKAFPRVRSAAMVSRYLQSRNWFSRVSGPCSFISVLFMLQDSIHHHPPWVSSASPNVWFHKVYNFKTQEKWTLEHVSAVRKGWIWGNGANNGYWETVL